MLKSNRMADIMTWGPINSNNCPITQGRNMPPALAPMKNQPVTRPVIGICRCARERVVGKIVATDRPTPTVPSQSTVDELDHIRAILILPRHPTSAPSNIVVGFTRVPVGMASKRPNVNDPQNADVRYAATVLLVSPTVTEYVNIHPPKLISAPA